MEIYKSHKIIIQNQTNVKFGLNMQFKDYHKFKLDPEQGGGPFAEKQQFSSLPWGYSGCPQKDQMSLVSYVT